MRRPFSRQRVEKRPSPRPTEKADQSDEKLQQADEQRNAKLMRAIAWLDTLRKTAIPDVVAAQRSRLTEELRQVALRRQRAVDVHTEVTERKRLEEHKTLLIRELDHRFKNMLSVISVIASRTQETTSSIPAIVTALDGRIKALTMTHELLSRRTREVGFGMSLAKVCSGGRARSSAHSGTRGRLGCMLMLSCNMHCVWLRIPQVCCLDSQQH